MKEKPTVGQEVFLHRKGELIGAEVVSVGRKYFCVARLASALPVKFRLDNWLEAGEFCAGWKVYASPRRRKRKSASVSRRCSDTTETSKT